MNWPQHYPNECPPSEAITRDADIYRVVWDNPPSAEDMTSYALRDSEKEWNEKKCQACGLSVFLTFKGCERARRRVPSLRQGHIAKASINGEMGVILNTPTKSNTEHQTWWHPEEMTPVHVSTLFTVVGEG